MLSRRLWGTLQTLVMEGNANSDEFCEGERADVLRVRRNHGRPGLEFTFLCKDDPWRTTGTMALSRTFFPPDHAFSRIRPYTRCSMRSPVVRGVGDVMVSVSSETYCSGVREPHEYFKHCFQGVRLSWLDSATTTLEEKLSVEFVLLEELSRNWAVAAHMRVVQRMSRAHDPGRFLVQPLRGGGWSVPTLALLPFLGAIQGGYNGRWVGLENDVTGRMELTPTNLLGTRDVAGVVDVEMLRSRRVITNTERTVLTLRLRGTSPGTPLRVSGYGERQCPFLPTYTRDHLAVMWQCPIADLCLRAFHLQCWLLAKAVMIETNLVIDAGAVASALEADQYARAEHAQALRTLVEYSALGSPHAFPDQWRLLVFNRVKRLEADANAWEIWGRQLQQLEGYFEMQAAKANSPRKAGGRKVAVSSCSSPDEASLVAADILHNLHPERGDCNLPCTLVLLSPTPAFQDIPLLQTVPHEPPHLRTWLSSERFRVPCVEN